MNDTETTVQKLKDIMAHFVAERDWNQFHNPKSIVMALAVEVGELMERFSWPSTEGCN
jgi:dCTP diphosphatase